MKKKKIKRENTEKIFHKYYDIRYLNMPENYRKAKNSQYNNTSNRFLIVILILIIMQNKIAF